MKFSMKSFLLYNKAKVLIIYAEKYIFSNIPKNYIVYRKNMEQAIFNLNIDIIKANNNEGNIRRKYQKDVLIDIQSVDLFLSILNDLKLVERKRFLVFLNMLEEIRKISIAWMDNETKK